MRLADRVIVVTGATGIAAAGARRFAAEGATVFTISIDADQCSQLHDTLDGEHGWEAADLTDETATARAFAAGRSRFGTIDGLFAVAGGSGRSMGDGPVETIPVDGWRATLDLNLTTSFLAVREAIKHMLALAGGSIVVTSSILAEHPSPQRFATHAYAAAKGAQLALVTSTAARYAAAGIRINALTPGLVQTPMSARAQEDGEILEYVGRKQPLSGGIIPAEDIAAAALFLLSDEARFVTGQVMAVDGGWGVTEA